MNRLSESLSSPKRIKLDPSLSPSEIDADPKNFTDDAEQEHCTICLQSFLDRTIIPVCAHEFCLECILLWSEQSRKCPLCSRSFDDSYLIHRIRSQYDYQKYHLPPLRSSSPPSLTSNSRATALRNTRRQRQWGRRQRQQREEVDQLERAIARRRWIYQHHLYAKHVASNPYTRYRPFPTPAQFSSSPDLISRMTIFLRRELRVWPNLDVEARSFNRATPRVDLTLFLHICYPIVSHNIHHIAHEINRYPLRICREIVIRISGSRHAVQCRREACQCGTLCAR
ncbi:hypothetical protein OG21DRAFT_1414891 [Imleria badia]|nr:hypothetical protein OG21DRAFT_1414891 [Imleria badia]